MQGKRLWVMGCVALLNWQVASAMAGGGIDTLRAASTVRTQSQRLAKLQLQARLGVLPEVARLRIRSGVDAMEQALSVLSAVGGDPRQQRTLARLHARWRVLRNELEASPEHADPDSLYMASEDMALAAGTLAGRMDGTADTPQARLMELSLRQNMLLQRMAKVSMLSHQGAAKAGALLDQAQARIEFTAALETLEQAPLLPKAAQDAVALARVQWQFFEVALEEGADQQAQRHLATTSERIGEMLDAVGQAMTDVVPTKLARAN